MPPTVTRYLQNVDGSAADLALAVRAMADQMEAQGCGAAETEWESVPVLMSEARDVGAGFVAIDIVPTPGTPDAWKLTARCR